MARKFQNPANDHIETVDSESSFGAFFLGFIYLIYKGLWPHVFIWLLVVVIPGLLSNGILLVLTVPLTSIFYGMAIQQILAARYLNRGWREVTAGTTSDDTGLAASTAAILASPDPMLPRKPAATKAADVKLCPFCAEEIRAAAIRCKHCRADLPATV